MKLVTGGLVFDGERRRFEPADLVIEDASIVAVLPPGAVQPEGREVIDARDRLVLPGLVNGHNHAQTNLGKGLGDRWTLELLLNHAPWTAGRRTLEDKYLSAAIGACELLRKGCTASYDMFAEFPLPTVDGVNAVAQAYADVGLRATIAPMMADRSFFEAIPGLVDSLPEDLRAQAQAIRLAPHDQTLAVCAELARGWRWASRGILLALGPTIPHHCSEAFLCGCRDLAREHGLGLQMHVAESKVQAVVARQRYGHSLVAHLDGLGLLGPGFCVAHGVWLDGEDRARLAAAGASVSHNPGSNLKLGSGLADTRAMLDAGITLAVGTDGAGSSDNLNVWEAMRLAAFVSRAQGRDRSQWLDAAEVLQAATAGGARALGFGDRIGRIAPGALADLVLLDLAAPHYVPLNDPLHQVVFCEDGTGVHTVMVGGEVLLQDGRFTRVDFEALRRQAAAAAARLAEVNAPARALAGRLEPWVNQYCRGLMAQPLGFSAYADCCAPLGSAGGVAAG